MKIAEEVCSRINGEEIADLALELANIYGPIGHEEEVGERVYDWLQTHGIPAQKQFVTETRFNVIGYLRGIGGGHNLAFNSHMDTRPMFRGEAQTGIEDMDAYRAWREGEKLFGLGMLNDRGPMAAFLIAAKAIKEAGIVMKGDLILTSVVGEIDSAPIEEYQGSKYLGKGIGTRHAVTHGPQVDYALVAETTDFGLSWVECGVAYIKVTVKGEGFYAPRYRSDLNLDLVEHPNAIVKMSRVVDVISRWSFEYQEKYKINSPCGIVRPKIGIGAIRGGLPSGTSILADSCSLYITVWLPPGMLLKTALTELDKLLRDTGIQATTEVFLHHKGFLAKGIDPLAVAVSEAYRELKGSDPLQVSEAITSMWRDTNIYNEVGIPALTFGPTRHQIDGCSDKFLIVSDLELTAKIYSKVALNICGLADKA